MSSWWRPVRSRRCRRSRGLDAALASGFALTIDDVLGNGKTLADGSARRDLRVLARVLNSRWIWSGSGHQVRLVDANPSFRARGLYRLPLEGGAALGGAGGARARTRCRVGRGRGWYGAASAMPRGARKSSPAVRSCWRLAGSPMIRSRAHCRAAGSACRWWVMRARPRSYGNAIHEAAYLARHI